MDETITRVWDIYGVRSGHAQLVEALRTRFDVPATGVLLVLDSDEHTPEDWGGSADGLGEYRFLPPSEKPLPEAVRRCSDGYTHLIRLTPEACGSDESIFARALGHELQHLHHALTAPHLAYACNLLLGVLDGPGAYVTLPTEIDCEVAAWLAVRDLLGEAIGMSCIEADSRWTYPEVKRAIQHALMGLHYDLLLETRKCLSRHKRPLARKYGDIEPILHQCGWPLETPIGFGS